MSNLEHGKLLSEIEFSNFFFKKLSEKISGIKLLKISPLEIKTKDENEEYIHFLDNSYSEYRSEPNDLDEILERYVKAAENLYSPREEINVSRIIPIIKDKRFLDEMFKLFKNENDNINVFEKYNSDLYIFYAEDREENISYLNIKDLEKLQIDKSDLLELATNNLNAIIESIERNGDENAFMLIAGGNYESSLILLDIWNKDNFPVLGEIIIGIPARDLLFVTGSEDKDSIERIEKTIIEINESGDHVVSDKLFHLVDNKFEVWNK
ncbi:DUF1444 family protein [Soonwooa sp.]|uniref:DUF1444 family protein n=1 Tax=Soonwooa sp. TaxID=1938592 RepID=UPI0026291F8F|nr:DUF1444 family protein [Soonwooa sp.]